MRGCTGKAVFVVLGLLLAFGGWRPAQAALIHDLVVTDFVNFTGTGQIAFSSKSGNSDAGVTAFTFNGRFTGTSMGQQVDETFVFDSPDQIQSIRWSIDDNWNLTTLNLSTNAVSSSSGANYCIYLRNDGAAGGCSTFFNTGSTSNLNWSRVARQITGSTATGIGLLSTTAVHEELPEPATLTLLGFGLAGLGFACRQRRKV